MDRENYREIPYVYSPWLGEELKKGTEFAFLFSMDDTPETPGFKWKKIYELGIFVSGMSKDIRVWVDYGPTTTTDENGNVIVQEEEHVRGMSLKTLRSWGCITRETYERLGGREKCMELLTPIHRKDKKEEKDKSSQ